MGDQAPRCATRSAAVSCSPEGREDVHIRGGGGTVPLVSATVAGETIAVTPAVRCSHGGGRAPFTPAPAVEIQLDALLRRYHLVLPITLATAAVLYGALIGCGVLYAAGVVTAVLPAAVIAHA